MPWRFLRGTGSRFTVLQRDSTPGGLWPITTAESKRLDGVSLSRRDFERLLLQIAPDQQLPPDVVDALWEQRRRELARRTTRPHPRHQEGADGNGN